MEKFYRENRENKKLLLKFFTKKELREKEKVYREENKKLLNKIVKKKIELDNLIKEKSIYKFTIK